MDVKNYRDSSSFHKPRFVRITNRKAFDFGECSPNRGLSFYLCRNMLREKIIRVTVPKSFLQSHSILRCIGIRGYIYKWEKKRHEEEIRVALSRRQMQLNGP